MFQTVLRETFKYEVPLKAHQIKILIYAGFRNFKIKYFRFQVSLIFFRGKPIVSVNYDIILRV